MTDDTSSSFCRRCTRHLTNPTSIKHGMGPVCYTKRMDGDLRQAKQIGPRTITSKDFARKVYQAIYRLINSLDEINLSRGKMLAHEDIQTLPVESFDSDNGIVLPGFGKPQWFYLHSSMYDLAIWKIGITDEKIMTEMEAHGDIPEGWTR